MFFCQLALHFVCHFFVSLLCLRKKPSFQNWGHDSRSVEKKKTSLARIGLYCRLEETHLLRLNLRPDWVIDCKSQVLGCDPNSELTDDTFKKRCKFWGGSIFFKDFFPILLTDLVFQDFLLHTDVPQGGKQVDGTAGQMAFPEILGNTTS